MGETETYRLFLQEYAPLGYARLYGHKGDFYRAQQALERSLVEGFRHWSSHHIPVHDRAKLMQRIVDGYGQLGAPSSDGEGPESSFSRSPKLRAIEEAIAILRSFTGIEQTAVFLMHVEEVDDERIAAWLEVEAPFMKELRERLGQKLAAWKPAVAVEETPAEFFFRALRQYRLSASFIPTVVSRLTVARVTTESSSRTFGCILAGAIPVVIVAVLAFSMVQNWRGMDRHGRNDQLMLMMLPTSNVVLDAVLAMTALLVSRFIQEQAPAALARGPASKYTTLLLLAAIVGFIFIVVAVFSFFAPWEFYRDADTIFWYVLIHQAWQLAAALAILLSGFHVGAYYLRRLDQLGPHEERKGTP